MSSSRSSRHDTSVMNLDDEISRIYIKGQQLTRDKPQTAPEAESFRNHEFPVELPPQLKELIEAQTSSHQIQQELKDLLMQWFWHGFYKGVQSQI